MTSTDDQSHTFESLAALARAIKPLPKTVSMHPTDFQFMRRNLGSTTELPQDGHLNRLAGLEVVQDPTLVVGVCEIKDAKGKVMQVVSLFGKQYGTGTPDDWKCEECGNRHSNKTDVCEGSLTRGTFADVPHVPVHRPGT